MLKVFCLYLFCLSNIEALCLWINKVGGQRLDSTTFCFKLSYPPLLQFIISFVSHHHDCYNLTMTLHSPRYSNIKTVVFIERHRATLTLKCLTSLETLLLIDEGFHEKDFLFAWWLGIVWILGSQFGGKCPPSAQLSLAFLGWQTLATLWQYWGRCQDDSEASFFTAGQL